jgi:hypothetical protein
MQGEYSAQVDPQEHVLHELLIEQLDELLQKIRL